MATPPGTGEPIEPLTYKTWVLKVSIHCEGCKRKVKRVLHSVEGVYTANIDTKQQKVIVTGDVSAETLIKKLEKSGKHAELWPATADQHKEKSSRKSSKNKDKQIDPETNTEEAAHGGPEPDDKEKPQAGKVQVQDSAKISEGVGSPRPPKKSEAGGGTVRFADAGAKNNGGQAVGSKSEGKKPELGSPVNQSPAAEKKGSESVVGSQQSGSGGGGKKKKKKGHKSPAESAASSGAGTPAASTGLPNHHAGPAPPVNLSPPRHHGYQQPPPVHYYAPLPTSSHTASYYAAPAPANSSHTASYYSSPPNSGHTASYYACPPPYSYTYMYPGPETEPPPSDLDSYPRQPLDSFELFSDENPNGCSIM